MAREVSGVALAAIGGGVVLAYGGLTGRSPLKVVQQVITGAAPSTAPSSKLHTAAPAGRGGGGGGQPGSGGHTVTGGNVHRIFQQTAAQFGWGSGAQWQALNALEMQEAGYQPRVVNSIGAIGLAQALDHGTAHTAGTLGNAYGNQGLSDAQNRAANSGDPAAQSLWMMRYIRGRYRDPITAWNGDASRGIPSYTARGNWY